jgi:hypothetical protein
MSSKVKIKIVEVTQYTPEQIENYYNTNLYDKGWRIVQIFTAGTKRYILAERAE